MALQGTGYSITVNRVDSLKPHERTIPENVTKIKDDLLKDGVQRDPILVDRNSSAVLDGMHRLAAFRQLGVEKVVCCEVDYESDGVTLGRWARAYGTGDTSHFVNAMTGLGLTLGSDIHTTIGLLDSGSVAVAALSGGKSYVPERLAGLEEAFLLVDRVDKLSAENNWKMEFIPEDGLEPALKDPGKAVLLVRRLRKTDVVDAARAGNLFPCKTSMHTVDPRPVAVNFPLADLSEATAESLRRWLVGKGQRLVPGGSVYEGRRYKERLLFMDGS